MTSIDSMWTSATELARNYAGSFVNYLPELLGALVVMVVAVFAARIVAKLITRGVSHIEYQGPAMTLVVAAAKVAVLAVGAFLAMGVLGLDKTVTSLLAGVGVLGIALGFAFQDIAANVMSGTLMAFKPPFDVGDLVETNGHIGTIESMTLRFTSVRTFEGQLALLPNKDVLAKPLVNFSTTGERRIDVAVGVGYGTDLEVALDEATKAVGALSEADQDKPIEAFFTGFGASSIDMTVRFWLRLGNAQSNYMLARSNAVRAIKRAFDEVDINIPFPIRTLDMNEDVAQLLAAPRSGPRATGS